MVRWQRREGVERFVSARIDANREIDVDATFEEYVRRAARLAKGKALDFPESVTKEELPWSVIAAFDSDIRGHVERDRRIEDERDHVLIAAVKLAETGPEDGADALSAARTSLDEAIDYLEEAVIRFGIVNGLGAKRGPLVDKM